MDAQTLRARRGRAGLTQSELGRALGVGRRHITRLEAGETPISRSMEIAINFVFDSNGDENGNDNN